jgi:acyl carrier protein
METIYNILKRLHPELERVDADGLVDDGILTSLDVVTLIMELNEAFEISIPVEEILPTNFNSAEAMYALVERMQDC